MEIVQIVVHKIGIVLVLMILLKNLVIIAMKLHEVCFRCIGSI